MLDMLGMCVWMNAWRWVPMVVLSNHVKPLWCRNLSSHVLDDAFFLEGDLQYPVQPPLCLGPFSLGICTMSLLGVVVLS
jgi:hypothetical protein